MSAVTEQFRIGELARRVGATPRTVRYYEELGPPARSAAARSGSHRLYDARDEERLRELLRIRELLGLSLSELRTWSDAEDARASLRERWHSGEALDAETRVGHRQRGAAAHRDADRARRLAARGARGARGRADRDAPARARDPARAAERVAVSTTLAPAPSRPAGAAGPSGDRYKWIALSNTTIAMLITTINSSIVLIALPDIFRGIHLDPLLPGNTSYLLWMMMGFMVATAVLVVTFGRIGDMYGRVRMFNLGLAVFTVCSILLSLTWMQGSDAALWLIAMRVGQGVGGALVMGNSSAILTDAFPQQRARARARRQRRRGDRGLVHGPRARRPAGARSTGGSSSWSPCRSASSAPSGRTGSCRSAASGGPARVDWWGNATFAVGLILVLVSITYGIQPYGGHPMGWTNPLVLAELIGGLLLLVAFVVIELRTKDPMFSLGLFRIRAFTAGTLATFLASLGRGGLMFMLIIWLQGIWLPLHGYSFSETPLWAGIYMLPLTVGFLIAGPVSGWLSDRFGARPFATGGMLVAALTFLLLELLPVNFDYRAFAALLLLMGLGMGLFAVAQPDGDHEQRARASPRRRRRHGGDVPELGDGALDRHLLLAHDRRPDAPRCRPR